MTSKKTARKFSPQQKKIEELTKKSPGFKRIFSEYELISDELWEMQNNGTNVPDDFIDAMKAQSEYLEYTIDDMLSTENSNAVK